MEKVNRLRKELGEFALMGHRQRVQRREGSIARDSRWGRVKEKKQKADKKRFRFQFTLVERGKRFDKGHTEERRIPTVTRPDRRLKKGSLSDTWTWPNRVRKRFVTLYWRRDPVT